MNKTSKAEMGEGNAPRWSEMTDAQLEYQADCFELHGDRIPKELERELDKRARANYDPEGSSRLMQLAERMAGA